MSVPSRKGCVTAAPELASGPCHHSPLHTMQMKAAAVRFPRSAQPPALCTSRCAWLAVRKQLGVLLFTRFHQLCPFRKHWCCLQRHQSRQSILLTAQRTEHNSAGGEWLPSTSQAGNACEEGESCFPNDRGNSQGELPSCPVASAHGGRGEGRWLWHASFARGSFPQLIERS